MNPESIYLCVVLLWIILTMGFVYAIAALFLRRRKQEEVAVTPVTKEGLREYDELPSGVAVVMAWSNPGNNPRWHRKMQDEVRSQMPVLARALDRMVED